MRIRTIKPEWLQDEKIASVSDVARVLSIGLILMSDDYGNGRAHEQFIASQVWTYGDSQENLMKVSRGLQELKDCGFVEIYEVDGQSYFHVINWGKHQKVQHPGKPLVPCNIKEDVKGMSVSREPHETLTPDPDPDLNQDQRPPTTGPREDFICSDTSKDWLKVMSTFKDLTGQPISPHAHQRDAEALLGLAKQMDDPDYLKTVQRVMKTWLGDEWVSENNPRLSHLVKYFDKYTKPNGSKTENKSNYRDRLRLIELEDQIPKVRDALERATNEGDQIRIQKHQKKLDEFYAEQNQLKELTR